MRPHSSTVLQISADVRCRPQIILTARSVNRDIFETHYCRSSQAHLPIYNRKRIHTLVKLRISLVQPLIYFIQSAHKIPMIAQYSFSVSGNSTCQNDSSIRGSSTGPSRITRMSCSAGYLKGDQSYAAPASHSELGSVEVACDCVKHDPSPAECPFHNILKVLSLLSCSPWRRIPVRF